jgi:hypothetical protein
MFTLIRIIASAISVGLFFALLGFFGPMFFFPGNYHLPATGLYVGGTFGLLLGAVIGGLREFRD